MIYLDGPDGWDLLVFILGLAIVIGIPIATLAWVLA